MTHAELTVLLSKVAEGTLSPAAAATRLKTAPVDPLLSGVTVDTHRQLRTGLGEVIFAQGKTNEQLEAALAKLSSPSEAPSASSPTNAYTPVLATRVDEMQGKFLTRVFPHGEWWPQARLFCLGHSLQLDTPAPSDPAQNPDVLILCAGSSDMPVALEALGTARFYGLRTALTADVGVAGLHRLAPHLHTIHQSKILIVAAGMEGALPSVVAGLTATPVIAVPTSVGYGAGAGGMTPLFAMLNACAPGISVMNIDNGYGAAAFAAKVLYSFQQADSE